MERNYIKNDSLFGRPIVQFEDLEMIYNPEDFFFFTAITYGSMNKLRERLYEGAKSKGFKPITYISPHAFVWENVKIGENCFIFENNVIQPFVRIGNNTILWSGNHVGHHSVIGNNVFISSQAVISGLVTVGDNSFIGVNSTIANGINIARNTLIGAGSLITRDTKEGSVYIGNYTLPKESKKSNEFL